MSFKAPLTIEGVSNIYVRYKGDQKTTFMLPMIVSGSTINDKNMTVQVRVDPDTLKVLNYERFQNREDFYYRELMSQYFSMTPAVHIKAGESTALMPIDFTLKNIDMVDKWVLPLTILDDASNGYKANPRKHYRKALLRIYPFNN